MPDISATLALLRKPLEATFEAASGRVKEYIANLKTDSAVKDLYGRLNATQKVKTIWNVDRPIALSSFYYPARIETKLGSQQLTSVDDLPSNHVVLIGIVGQGKSILLRYLLGREIRSGKRVPVFVELRRVPASQNLESYVTSLFNELMEMPGNRELFPTFAGGGRLSLFLDGFDEVDPLRVHEFASAIDLIAQKYPSLRVLVTSRPNSGIENSPLFDVIPVAPLSQADLPGFFAKILQRDKDLAGRLTAAVSHSSAVAKMASTPLLATLLSIVYRAHQKIPTDFPEFYDAVFQILLVRHDRAKNGYERKRKTQLSDRDIQLVFEAFCYKTKADSKPSVEEKRALELATQSALAQELECRAEDFLSDITKITCLLQEEGGRLEFLHQSVQEFFAARYIASRPEEVAQKFYALAAQEEHWQQWDQVIRFLSEIDPYRASRHFYVPLLSATLNWLSALTVNPSPQHLRNIIAAKIGVRQSLVASKKNGLKEPKYFIHHLERQKMYHLELVHNQLFRKFFGSDSAISKKWPSLFDRKTADQFISYLEIAEGCGESGLLDMTLLDAVSSLRAEYKKHNDRVLRYNDSSAFMGL